MANITWSDAFSVNVKAMDDQHKKLINMVNDITEAALNNRDSGVLDKVFMDMMVYVSVHFKAEEQLMEKHGYPDFEEHKGKHAGIAEQVTKLREESKANPEAGMMKIMRFLTDWLTKHIMGTDKKYGEYLNSKGVY